jgi:hypothetical protein
VNSTKAFFICVLLLACGAGSEHRARAQQQQSAAQPPPAATQSSSASTPTTNDLEITANVTARELRFEVVPNPTVEFTGKPERETVWEAERQNLPRPVEPGVTYRNIGIQLKISSRFADIDRIVAEALGEVPVTDDRPAATPTPQPNAPPADTTASPSTTQERKP